MADSPLNVFQRLIRTWEAVHPYNAAQVLKLCGRADPAAARAAWEQSLAAAGLGRVRIAGRTVFHETMGGLSQDHAVQILPPGTALTGHLSESLNRRFDDPTEPPFRPFLIADDDAWHFGVVYQHWIADSVSIRLLLREWCARMYGPPSIQTSPPSICKAGYWRAFGPSHCDVRPGQTALALFRTHMRFRRVLKVAPTAGNDSPTRVLLHELPEGLAEQLHRAARAAGANVGDILQAAVAQACRLHVPMQRRRNRRDIAIGNIVDLRRYAGPNRGSANPLDNALGLFLGFTQVFCRPDVLRDFPRLLRSISLQNRAHRQSGIAQCSAGWMLAALAMGRLVPPERLYRFYRKEIPLAAGLSNVNLNGSWAQALHPLPLLDYIRVSPTGPMAPVVLNVTSLGRRMNLALTYRTALLNEARAQAMVRSVAGAVLSAGGAYLVA